MTIPAILYAYSGLTLLSLAMNRHYRQVWNRVPSVSTSRVFTLCGWALLAASLVTSILTGSWTIGLVAWIGSLSAAAAALIFMLPYRPMIAMQLALVMPVLATTLIFVEQRAW